MKRAFLICIIVCCALVQSTPVIDSISGSFADGENFTVRGQGFGIKNPVEPYKFDDFSSGREIIGRSVNTTASGGVAWSYFSSCASQGKLTPLSGFRYSENHSRYPGDISGWKYFGYNDLYSCYQGTNYLTLRKPDGYKEAYWSMWLYSETNGQDAKVRNVKIANWNNDARGYPQGRWDFYPTQGRGSGHVYALSCGSSSSNQWGVGASAFGYGSQQWNRFEGYLDAGDPGVANGRYEVSRNGTLMKSTGDVMIRNDASCPLPDLFLFTHYHDDIDTSYEPPMPVENLYHSEIYFDITQARVELCDSPQWVTRGHCEIQLPHTEWLDNSLRFALRKGSFIDENLYLYVIDAEGEVNMDGYGLTAEEQVTIQILLLRIERWMDGDLDLSSLMQAIGRWKEGQE